MDKKGPKAYYYDTILGHKQSAMWSGCILQSYILNMALDGLRLKPVKVDMVANRHVKIYVFKVKGSGHSYQCLLSTAAP